MEYELLEDPIKVRADFNAGKVEPLMFKRHGRVYRVSELHAWWKDISTGEKIFFFSVTAEGDVYHLRWRREDDTWTLHAVVIDG